MRSGMAEVIKHGIIADPGLFISVREGWEALLDDIDMIVKLAMRVKIDVIVEDPYEKGKRAVLNLGHTLGHALEAQSGYRLKHGEAVSIGIAAAAKLSMRMGMAGDDLVQSIRETLGVWGSRSPSRRMWIGRK